MLNKTKMEILNKYEEKRKEVLQMSLEHVETLLKELRGQGAKNRKNPLLFIDKIYKVAYGRRYRLLKLEKKENNKEQLIPYISKQRIIDYCNTVCELANKNDNFYSLNEFRRNFKI